MSTHSHAAETDAADLRKLLVALIARELKRVDGITEVKKVFHGVIGDKKGQIARTPQLDAAIAALIHDATDVLIQDDGDGDQSNAALGKAVRSLVCGGGPPPARR